MNAKKLRAHPIPHLLGLRTLKTVLAVFLSAAFMQYVMGETPFFACIGAVVAMESSLQRSLHAAAVRNIGTITGGLIGIAVASFTDSLLLTSLGLIPVIITDTLLGRRECVVPGAIVYFAVAYLNTMDQAWIYGLRRILGTLIGTLIAIAINALLFPPKPAPKAEL